MDKAPAAAGERAKDAEHIRRLLKDAINAARCEGAKIIDVDQMIAAVERHYAGEVPLSLYELRCEVFDLASESGLPVTIGPPTQPSGAP